MFGSENPAPDVDVLLGHLAEDHRDGDLYRGQVKDYPALVTSVYRKAIVPGSAADRVVKIDPDLFYREIEANPVLAARHGYMAVLIREVGLALGNLLAQQYGLSSECLDVSENPRIAAFFATRKWPEYAHYPGPDLGVIYRFRRTDDGSHPPDTSLDTIANWLEMGQADGAYYDFFVREDELDRVFDRDRWWGRIPPRRVTASTLPLTVRWSDVLRTQDAWAAASRRNPPREEYHRGWFGEMILAADWRRSRVAGQEGGLLRPAFYWEADVPEQSVLYQSDRAPGTPAPGVQLRNMMVDDRMPWPRASPSAAIKRQLVGIENLRYRPGCQAFHFRHGATKVTGLYRRDLWPEPSEDPVYGAIWQRAITHQMSTAGIPGLPPAIDDPDVGLLDRGYRVAGELRTRDARDLDDLMRGQLEDAREAVASARAVDKDYVRLAGGLARKGDVDGALKWSLDGAKTWPNSPRLQLSVAALLDAKGQKAEARRAALRAESLDPEDPDVQEALATMDMDAGDFAPAARRLDAALATFDPAIHQGPEYELVMKRGIVAGILGEAAIYLQMLERYRRLEFHPDRLADHVDRLRSARGLGPLPRK
jgi:hypothetical protein